MGTRGLVVGKFYPPHLGHSSLIERARAQVDRLTVMVCDKPGIHTIPGALRGDWLRELHPAVDVRVIDDTLGDDEFDAWAENTVAVLGFAPDVVFSSESYGEPYAAALGSRHVWLDRVLDGMSVSATMIRADPLHHWERLAPPVRAHLAPRIAVVGAESSGKTTLSVDLARHYRTAWVPEYGRIYSEGKLYAADAEHWDSAEFVTIARAQNQLEDALARVCNRLLICDTNAFATSIWHERYLGSRSPDVEAQLRDRRYLLHLVPDVDIPFQDDGLRDGERIRHWMHDRFLAELASRRAPFVLVSGSPELRLRQSIAAIDALVAAFQPFGAPVG